MLKEKAFKIGRIIKTHGVAGQISVAAEMSIKDTDVWPDWIFIDIDSGLVPFRSDPEGMIWRDYKHIVIDLEDYDRQDDVQRFIGYDLWFPNEFKNIINVSQSQESPFLGFILMDSYGNELGKIEEYIDVPGNPLFKLNISDEEVLIPAREEWIIEQDNTARRITMDLPDGLIELSSP